MDSLKCNEDHLWMLSVNSPTQNVSLIQIWCIGTLDDLLITVTCDICCDWLHLYSPGGVLQLVQTSSGHQILTTNLQTSYPISVSSTLSTTTTTTALPSSLTLSATVANSTLPPVSVASSSTGVSLLKCPALVLQQNQQKPVMRVSPFVVSSTDVSSSVQGNALLVKSALACWFMFVIVNN